ncbi:cbb3-type cytochrome oxidase subunit 3 [Sapientia aquatica]|uniref:Cbb3-type cytochrome c oxidase subunit 3 n=1 Tax=Sapientia aquatica TaxID=1549640 RepID=A0A4R5W6D7_9BURK|nr:cbb3-type cytochrome c oxidase subunit 3 [Sapientia aquatica]TDK68687.1 cbb3-type cytochrome c oxidase subunit 3 [Sapientia aquatica]
MDFSLLSSIFTVLSLVVFIGILYWAFSTRNKAKFEAIGRSLIDNDNGKD